MFLFYTECEPCLTTILFFISTMIFFILGSGNGVLAENENHNSHIYHERDMKPNISNISQLEIIPMDYPGPPRNVSGFVIWDSDLHIFRLNLTWLPPEDIEKVNGYNLTYYCIPSPCKSNHHIDSEFIADAAITSILLPPSEDADFISLNSSIRVLIHSVPFDEFSNSSIRFDYDVPYCISNNGSPKCHCGHMNYLPKPNIRAELKLNNKINVTWTIPEKILEKNDSRYSYILVYITVSKVISSNNANGNGKLKLIYNETLVHTLSELENEHWQVLNFEFDSHAKLVASIQLWDATSCHTRTIYNEVISEKMNDANEEQQWFLVAIGVCVAFFIILFIVVYKGICFKIPFVSKNCLKPNKKISHYSNLLGNTPDRYLKLRKLRSHAIPLEMNICYVEKQIDDAKACGFVDDYEIDYRRLTFRKLVGKGAFGCVYEATAEAIAGVPGKTFVAVKKFNGTSTDEAEEFLGEIAILKKAGRHPHIVTLLGCCTLKEPFCMIMEYLPHGDLNRYLVGLRNEFERRKYMLTNRNKTDSNHKDNSNMTKDFTNSDLNSARGDKSSANNTEFTIISEDRYTSLDALDERSDKRLDELEYILDSNELQRFALQIAEGMAHLEKKQITHRDLAARNVLIDNNRNLKISDFGLSRPGIYVNTRNKKVPIRWLSIEAIRDHLYSSKSDVWAYAVVLWEIATLGAFPYCTLDISKLLQYLLDGKRLEKPENLSDEIYRIMLSCWSHCADDRPSFAELVERLNHLTKRKTYVTFECLNPTYMFPPTEEELQNVNCN